MNVDNGLIVLDVTWSYLKTICQSKSIFMQHSENDFFYEIFAIDSPIVYAVKLYRSNVPIGINEQENNDNIQDFENNHKSHSNKSLRPSTSDGVIKTVPQPREGSEVIYCSSNFCDPCTWYSMSTRVTGETLSTSDGYKFSSVNLNWIDIVSGRCLDDDGLAEEQMMLNPGDPHGYSVVIKLDGVVKNARAPFSNSGGDYEIFYEDGYVKFFNHTTGVVTADYSYAGSSVFILKPLPGKFLDIESAEADFCENVVMNDTIFYSVYGYVDYFAPQLMPGIPSGTKIPLLTNKYKRYSQILREAVGAYPTLLPNAYKEEHKNLSKKEFTRQSRGSREKIFAVPFRYGTKRRLSSAAGMELRVGLVNDTPFDGESATITLYCTAGEE